MQDYYPEDPPQSSEEIVAQLTVYVEADGTIGYNCDWIPGSSGTIAIGSIFYKLIHDELILKIFDEVKAQCVIDNAEDLADINDTVEKLVQHYREDDDDQDRLAVNPSRVPKL
tara:strand:- start:118 stop:456 length:339 start_codon:yes stop_codon:yes gene_type:complete